MIRSILLLFLIALLCGCRDPKQQAAVTWEQEPTDYTLLIIIDPDTVNKNPRAADFVVYALDYYFRDRVGTNDHVIISGLGTEAPVMFEGNPRTLREDYPSEQQFRDFLKSRGNPDRKINDGVAKSLKYISRTSGVKRGGAVPVALIVSSMIDGQPESKDSEDRVIQSLIDFGTITRGHIAYYFCDQNRLDVIDERMKKAGFNMTILECDVNGRPPLPTFHR